MKIRIIKVKMGAGRGEGGISVDGVRENNIMQLKKLNSILFPVRYNHKYYSDSLASGDFTKLGLSLSNSHLSFSFLMMILLAFFFFFYF